MKSFFDFANIRLNRNKCEVMAINPKEEEEKIEINGVRKE
jgi:hypothetical protein